MRIDAVPSSPILVTFVLQVIRSSETSVLTRATRRKIPKEIILHCHRQEHFKFYTLIDIYYVRFEVFTAVTMKNGVFWDVTPCDSCKNRRFEGTFLSSWWRRRQVPPKRRFLQEPHGVTSQNTPLFRYLQARQVALLFNSIQFTVLGVWSRVVDITRDVYLCFDWSCRECLSNGFVNLNAVR
jgi:hypothetical protein